MKITMSHPAKREPVMVVAQYGAGFFTQSAGEGAYFTNNDGLTYPCSDSWDSILRTAETIGRTILYTGDEVTITL